MTSNLSGVDQERSTARTESPRDASPRYPSVITAEMLPRWAHISDGELAADALETLSEAKLYERLGRATEVDERCEFIAFLHRLQFARVAHRGVPPSVVLAVDRSRSTPEQTKESSLIAPPDTGAEP